MTSFATEKCKIVEQDSQDSSCKISLWNHRHGGIEWQNPRQQSAQRSGCASHSPPLHSLLSLLPPPSRRRRISRFSLSSLDLVLLPPSSLSQRSLLPQCQSSFLGCGSPPIQPLGLDLTVTPLLAIEFSRFRFF